jgi:hypothetical protein
MCLHRVGLRHATRIQLVHDVVRMTSRGRSEEENQERLEKAKQREVDVKSDPRSNGENVSDGQSYSDKIVRDVVGLVR